MKLCKQAMVHLCPVMIVAGTCVPQAMVHRAFAACYTTFTAKNSIQAEAFKNQQRARGSNGKIAHVIA